MAPPVTSDRLSANGTCRWRLSATEQVIFSKPLTSRQITVVKPFQTHRHNQVVTVEEKVYVKRHSPYRKVPSKQSNFITWAESASLIVDRFARLKDRAEEDATQECVVEVLHNDGRVVIYSCNKGEEDFDAGDRWATARPVGAYTDLRAHIFELH